MSIYTLSFVRNDRQGGRNECSIGIFAGFFGDDRCRVSVLPAEFFKKTEGKTSGQPSLHPQNRERLEVMAIVELRAPFSL